MSIFILTAFCFMVASLPWIFVIDKKNKQLDSDVYSIRFLRPWGEELYEEFVCVPEDKIDMIIGRLSSQKCEDFEVTYLGKVIRK